VNDSNFSCVCIEGTLDNSKLASYCLFYSVINQQIRCSCATGCLINVAAPTRRHDGALPMKYEEGSLNKETRQAFRTISRLMELFDTINDEDRLLAHRTPGMK
jgi:hypothetical protein